MLRLLFYSLGILIALGLEVIILIYSVLQLPHVIQDTPAIEIMKSIIEVDGVLIGFTGLIGTVLYTRPLQRGKGFLQGTLLFVAGSSAFLLLSILCSIFAIAEIRLEFGLSRAYLFSPILLLIWGVTMLFFFIGAAIEIIPLPEI